MTTLLRLAVLAALLGLAMPAQAVTLGLPSNAQETAERITEPDSYRAPVAAFDGAAVPYVTVEGRITRRAWRLASQGLTTLQVFGPLRAQLQEMGYDIVFECENEGCGGFDFRFQIEVLPSPNMYVNIGRFRFLTAVRGAPESPEEAVTVLVSATNASAYVQVIHAVAGAIAPPLETGIDALREDGAPAGIAALADRPPLEPGSVEARLARAGFLVLHDLEFASGSTDLGLGPYASLEALARALKAQPEWRLALVGHSDTVGGLAPNLALSRARAASVRARLIDTYGIAPERLDAEGIGYLSPIVTNRTPEGRAENRRVEAVLLATD